MFALKGSSPFLVPTLALPSLFYLPDFVSSSVFLVQDSQGCVIGFIPRGFFFFPATGLYDPVPEVSDWPGMPAQSVVFLLSSYNLKLQSNCYSIMLTLWFILVLYLGMSTLFVASKLRNYILKNRCMATHQKKKKKILFLLLCHSHYSDHFPLL